MAIQPREEWTRQFLVNLDAFQAGRRNGTTSCSGSTGPIPDIPVDPGSETRGGNGPAAPSCPEHIKVYPDLGAACLRERLDLPYRLWLLLRPAHQGRGLVSLEDAYNLSVGTRRETMRWLRQGAGVFWTRAGDHYRLAGLENVSRSLGVAPEKHGAYVPMVDIKNLARFRAAIYGAWFIKPVTISQAKLSAIFGRKPRTLQRWAKLAGLEIGPNLAWTPLPDETNLGEKAAEVKARYYWTEEWKGPPGQRHRRGDKPDDLVVLLWIQPNTYRAPYRRAPKTRLQRHVCRALSKLEPSSRANGQRVYCHRGPGQARQAARLIEAGGIAFMEEARAHHGYGLWGYCAQPKMS